jgi:two-component system nitrogen regulation sensor histidine kinase NtrY
MVDEFSAFARMPQPVLRPEDPGEIIRQTVFLQRNAHPAIAYTVDLPDEVPRVSCDRRLIGQALTNLLANAADAVAAREGAGAIRVALEQAPGELRIVVEDDGVGLPEEGRDTLTEPYVTRKTKGTGLGLAIVKKIMEDHAGRLVLSDRADGTPGARVVLALPLAAAAQTMSEMPRMAHGA